MSTLKNFREVGLFDILIAPISPLKTFDAETFKTEAAQLLEDNTTNLVVDLAGLDFLYSDAFNAFMVVQSKVAEKEGVFGILTSNEIIIKGLQQAGLDRVVHVFKREADVMGFSLASNKKIESKVADVERLERPTAVLSQNSGGSDTVKSKSHRLTQSYNAIDKTTTDVKGMGDPFTGSHSVVESKSNTLWFILGALGILVFLAALLTFVR